MGFQSRKALHGQLSTPFGQNVCARTQIVFDECAGEVLQNMVKILGRKCNSGWTFRYLARIFKDASASNLCWIQCDLGT